MARPTQLTLCSFCGKSHAEVKKLIQGPGVYICDSCIIVCKNVLDKELRAESRKQLPKLNVPKPAEIRRQLDLHCIGQEHSKKTLAVAVHNHYKRIQSGQSCREESESGHGDVEIEKSNLLLIGPTGSGQTLLARTPEGVLDVPLALPPDPTL